MKPRLLALCCCLSFLNACGPAPVPGPPEGIRLIDIGGRKLQLQIRGKGDPTIVIEAGMGEPGEYRSPSEDPELVISGIRSVLEQVKPAND